MASAAPSSIILYRDKDWLVVDKPCGLPTHAASPGGMGVVEWLSLHLGITTHVVSRLDGQTSGALLLALNPAASARAERIHRDGGAVKTYEFLSAGDSLAGFGSEAWRRDDPLDEKTAATEFQRLGPATVLPSLSIPPVFRYRASISSGRRHQIRRHAAMSGVPLLGDEEYGGAPFARLCLHCTRIDWPEISQPIVSPLPPSLRLLAEGSGGDPCFSVCRDRRGLWPATVGDAFRVIHRGEIPGLPASLDLFGPWFHAVWYDEQTPLAEAEAVLRPVLDQAARIWALQGGVIRGHRRNPHEEDLVSERLAVGDPVPRVFAVSEHDLKFQINLQTTQHAGLFLDQRDTRRWIALQASGKRLANLFAYTCSFSVAAAAERAEVAFSVDTARPCLNTGKTNFELNGLTETKIGKFVQQDARKWLRRQLKRQEEEPDEHRPLDLIVCDPPVFASSRDGGAFSLEKEWPFLAEAAARLLADDGAALFANNHQGGDHRAYRAELESRFGEVVDLDPPLDFPVIKGEPRHVRIFLCRGAGRG